MKSPLSAQALEDDLLVASGAASTEDFALISKGYYAVVSEDSAVASKGDPESQDSNVASKEERIRFFKKVQK